MIEEYRVMAKEAKELLTKICNFKKKYENDLLDIDDCIGCVWCALWQDSPCFSMRFKEEK